VRVSPTFGRSSVVVHAGSNSVSAEAMIFFTISPLLEQ
jgi:hypothetical protein